MDTDDLRKSVKGMIRIGTVESVYPERMTARVIYEDKDNNKSQELMIINRGAKANKDYWLPDIGDEAICLFPNNDKNFATGFIICTHFSDTMPPQVNNKDVRRLDFSDGTYIEYNRASHELNINCVGVINIKGARINLN